MAKDDYFVIVYRLLKYLYACLKKSKDPSTEVLDAEFFMIDEKYWEYIIRHLKEGEYVEGVTLISLMNRPDKCVKIGLNFKITPKGIQYLEENPIFQKVKGAVKDIAEIFPI
jgi:hypothetical protein